MSWGITLYPLTVLVLILLFWNHLEVAAARFGVFSPSVMEWPTVVGEGAWDAHKTPVESGQKAGPVLLPMVFFGALGAFVLLTWTAPGRYSWAFCSRGDRGDRPHGRWGRIATPGTRR